MCQQLPPASARQQQEVTLYLALGNALIAYGEDTSERAQVSARVYALGQRIGDPGQMARSLVMMAETAIVRGQLAELAAIGEQLLSLAQHPHVAASATLTAQVALYVDYVWGLFCFFRGDLPVARRHLAGVSIRGTFGIRVIWIHLQRYIWANLLGKLSNNNSRYRFWP